MIEGVDYTGDPRPPRPAALKEAGKSFACRYGGPGGSWKQLTAAEAKALTGAGIALVSNAEGAADGLKGGYAAGLAWAKSAGAFFKPLGMPAGRPIYLSVDFDASTGDWPALDSAFRGARDGLTPYGYEVGAYAEYDVLEHLYQVGTVRWFWQTYAWSAGRIWRPDKLHIYQYKNGVSLDGVSVDLDRAYRQDYGQWGVTTMDTIRSDSDGLPLIERIASIFANSDGVAHGANNAPEKNQLKVALAALLAQSKANGDALSKLLARPTTAPTLTDEQVTAIGSQVAGALALLLSSDRLTPAIETAVREVLRTGTDGQ